MKIGKHIGTDKEEITELMEKESERISMFGADKDLEEWKKEDRLDLKDR